MIDRGALVLAMLPGARAYRGVHRPPLDAQAFTGRKGKDLAQRYAALVVDGEGVLEDLDDALAMRAEAEKMGLKGLDVVIFEVPQEPAPRPGALPIASAPPAEGLTLLGYDVIELMEPFWSLLSPQLPEGTACNESGLIARREDAEALARRASEGSDEPLHAVRVWLAKGA